MNAQYFTLADVSEILHTQPYRITYLLTTRQVQEPTMRIAGRRAFTMEDVQHLAAALNIDLVQQLVAKERGTP